MDETTPQQSRESLQDAHDCLSRVNGALELQAAVLALLVPKGSERSKRAWHGETRSVANAEIVFGHVQTLPCSARLPWLEVLVARLRKQPASARQSLLESARRLMGADGVFRPVDRLHWLGMRQWLGASAGAIARSAATSELSQLSPDHLSAIAKYSAFLSRMVPVDDGPQIHDPSPATPRRAGVIWYDAVMSNWNPAGPSGLCEPPDTDGMVHSLHELQSMAWMQRPVLARTWVDAAVRFSPRGLIGDTAADALRLSCSLLDSPLPPALAQRFVAVEAATPRH